jgi:hypothetical protein
MGRRPEANHMGRNFNRTIVLISGAVIERDMNRHKFFVLLSGLPKYVPRATSGSPMNEAIVAWTPRTVFRKLL